VKSLYGQRTTILSIQRGSVQQCQYCGANVDLGSEEITQTVPEPQADADDEDEEEENQVESADGLAGLRALKRPIALLLVAPVFLGLGLLALILLVWLAGVFFAV